MTVHSASYFGDVSIGQTIDVKFTTVDSTGAPTTLAGTPAVSAYPNNSTTEITAGITLTVDFDSVTGLNNVRVAATSGNGYGAGSSYALVITTGTVDAVSAVGYVITHFTIDQRRLTAAKLDADAAAEIADAVWDEATAGHTTGGTFGEQAGTDIDAILTDTGTTLQAELDGIQADTEDIQTRLPAALVSGRIDASVGAMASSVLTAAAIASDAITAAKIAADAIGASEIATDAVSEIVTAVLTTAMTEAYNTDGSAPTVAQALMGILQRLTEFSISGTTITVKKLDGSSTAMTLTLNSATSPTSSTRAS